MLKISFHFSGSKKKKEGLWEIIDGFAGHLGMIGGGSCDMKTNDFELYYEAHKDCDCAAYPTKARISPKMRNNLVGFVKNLPKIEDFKSEVIR